MVYIMLNKRYIVGIVLIFFMAIAIASAVDDVSSAKYKKFDSGKKINSNNGNIATWTAYSNGKTVKTTLNVYAKKGNKKVKIAYTEFTLTKISKNKLNIVITGKNSKNKYTEKTSLSAKAYYNKYIKSIYKSL